MSDLESSFLQQIVRQPEHSLHRLIYADWLEEQGDPRGELLRIQEQLRTLDVPNGLQVEARMHELIARGVQPLTITRTNSIGIRLVLIFPGQFRMGSPPEEKARSGDESQVNVTLTQGFWVAEFAVTQAEYETVVGHNPSYFNRLRLRTDSSRHPVEQVNWYEAMEFCQKLTKQERATGQLPADWEYTLPSEAQWEYACRAGTTTATAFGDSLSSVQANFSGACPYNSAAEGESIERTAAVGSYRANAWYLYDMHGNVLEWCRDCHATELPGGTDPEGEDMAVFRVGRGGSWSDTG